MDELSAHMLRLERDIELVKKLGRQANERVNNLFSSEYLTRELVNFYKEQVGV